VDHEDGELLILGLMENAGVEVVYPMVVDRGVWHVGGSVYGSVFVGSQNVYFLITLWSLRLML